MIAGMRKNENGKSKCVWKKRMWKRGLAGVCLAVTVMQMSACSATELEDRCFPMMAVVDYKDGNVTFAYGFPQLSQKNNTDVQAGKMDAPMTKGVDFSAAVKKSNQELDKKADCNHMKVLVFSKELLGQQDIYLDIIEELRKSELFPRNVYVCVAQDAKELLQVEEKLSTDVGSYLEKFLLSHEEEKEIKLTNLGTLMDEEQNRSKEIALPYVVIKNDTILWDGEYKINMTEFE